jgi:general secretion pathway protein H
MISRVEAPERPGSAPDFSAESGFTLIEMLVVLTVLGLVLGIALGHGPMRSATLEARAAAGDLAHGLRAARDRAIAGNRRVVVAIDPERHMLRVDGEAPRPFALRLEVRAFTALGTGAVRLIRFAPDGSSSGGSILLTDGARRVTVTVDWLTGRVRVVEPGRAAP